MKNLKTLLLFIIPIINSGKIIDKHPFSTLEIITISDTNQKPLSTFQHINGEKLYLTHCSRCHGIKGNKGFPKAKKLNKSNVIDTTAFNFIQKGKRIMPSFENKLTELEINTLIEYIKGFR